jgi:hypothetical protein
MPEDKGASRGGGSGWLKRRRSNRMKLKGKRGNEELRQKVKKKTLDPNCHITQFSNCKL